MGVALLPDVAELLATFPHDLGQGEPHMLINPAHSMRMTSPSLRMNTFIVRYWRIVLGGAYLLLFFWWSAMVVPTSNSEGSKFKGTGNLVGDLILNIIPYLALATLALLFWKKIPCSLHICLVLFFFLGGVLYKML